MKGLWSCNTGPILFPLISLLRPGGGIRRQCGILCCGSLLGHLCCVALCSFPVEIMVDQVKILISKYQQRLRCLYFHDHISGATHLEKTVMRTSSFTRISSSIWILASSFWSMWDWFAARWRVTLTVAIGPGALALNATVLDRGGVVSLLPCAQSQNISSRLHGFSIITSLSRLLCFSCTTSCASKLSRLWQNIASVQLRSQTEASSWKRPCSCTWRVASRRPTDLRRSSRSTSASSVGANITGATTLRINGFLAVLRASPVKVSRSHSEQNCRRFYGRYRCIDRTRHYDHQWLLGLDTPQRQPQHRVRWTAYWRPQQNNREHLA